MLLSLSRKKLDPLLPPALSLICFNSSIEQDAKVSLLLCLSIEIITGLSLSTYFGLAYSQENKTLIQQQGLQGMSSNGTNIILVHGGWADGTGWAKQISLLHEAGHQVMAVQLPLHSLILSMQQSSPKDSWFRIVEDFYT